MKNNLKNYISAVLFIMLINNIGLANNFTFDAAEIKLLDNGNIVNAKNGIAKANENNIRIEAEELWYNKKSGTLKTTSGTAYIVDKNIEIKANEFIYDSNEFLISAFGSVEVSHLEKNIIIKSENLTYNEKNKIIKSPVKSIITYQFDNIINTDSFMYTLANDRIKIFKAKIIGSEGDVIHVENAFLDLISQNIIGKNISIDFNNKIPQSENEPRLSGSTISSKSEETIIKEGVFTTCKKNDSCPPWQFSAEEIKHDKKKKIIHYKNAWLKIYDKPVFYFPKFFHPDPSVKRQSGFLMPSFQSSNNAGSSFNLPYYKVMSDNKDLTLSPRFYSNEKFLIQSEYRQINEDSKHLIDFSFVNEKKTSSKNHLFLNSQKKLDFSYFDESELDLNIEQVSDDSYLKTYKMKSPIIQNYDFLKSSITVEGFKEDLTMNIEFEVYEDLSLSNNDRYEYVLPRYNFLKEFKQNERIEGNFSLNSSGFIKNYNTNIFEKVAINDLVFNSNPVFKANGLKNSYNYLIKNINTDTTKSLKYKNHLNTELASIFEFNSSYPLKKEVDGYNNILKPIISLRYSPNDSHNMRKENRRIDTNNIFSLNRINSNTSVEGGSSITYGTQFIKSDLMDKEILNIMLVNIFKPKEDTNLPINSSLGEKTSDIFGSINFSPNDVWSIGYDFAQKNNLTDTNFEILKSQININNFITSFEYLNENNTIKKESYLFNKTSYNFDQSNNISFSTRKNKKTKLTEFYNLTYEYSNDCLVAGLEYNKDYYSDRNLKPDENLFFKLTIIPFGQTSSPNLK